MTINYSKLKDSIDNIERQYKRYLELKKKGFQNKIDKEIYETALVKCFETAFEMTGKHLKKYLNQQGFAELPDSPKKLLKKAHEAGIIEYIDLWMEYCENRNLTAHDYSDKKAFNVVEIIEDFIEDLQDLYNSIKND